MMTYEEFMDTDLAYEFDDIHYEPEAGIVYGTVNNGFYYRSEYYGYGTQVAFHLDTGIVRKVWTDSLVDTDSLV